MTRASPVEPLTFNVAGLLGEPPGSTHEYTLAGVTVPLEDDRRLSDPIEGRLRVTRTNRGVLIRADLATGLEAECSRCLQPIQVPLALRLDEEVLPVIDISSGLPLDRAGELDVARLTDHHELELETLVREAIDLAEPIAPLCRLDCPGLCPECGERLDGPPHDHPDEPVDPRLETLRGFRVDGRPGSE